MRDSLSWTQIRNNLSQLFHLKVKKAEAYGERGVNDGPSDFMCGSFALYPVALSHYPSFRGRDAIVTLTQPTHSLEEIQSPRTNEIQGW